MGEVELREGVWGRYGGMLVGRVEGVLETLGRLSLVVREVGVGGIGGDSGCKDEEHPRRTIRVSFAEIEVEDSDNVTPSRRTEQQGRRRRPSNARQADPNRTSPKTKRMGYQCSKNRRCGEDVGEYTLRLFGYLDKEIRESEGARGWLESRKVGKRYLYLR